MRTIISRTLDLRGLTGPLPVARTAVAMAAMDPGEQTEDGGVYRLVIRKR